MGEGTKRRILRLCVNDIRWRIGVAMRAYAKTHSHWEARNLLDGADALAHKLASRTGFYRDREHLIEKP